MSMELKNYETILILTPVLSEEQLEEATHKFRSFLQEKKVTIVHEDKIGLKKLAYPIQHKSTGFYHLFEFKLIIVVKGFQLRDHLILILVLPDAYVRSNQVCKTKRSVVFE